MNPVAIAMTTTRSEGLLLKSANYVRFTCGDLIPELQPTHSPNILVYQIGSNIQMWTVSVIPLALVVIFARLASR